MNDGMGRRYYRNVIKVEILSEGRWFGEIKDLGLVAMMASQGSSSAAVTRTVVNEEVTAERMAELLGAQGSSPGFLAARGGDEEESGASPEEGTRS